ncbi:MAG TPA: hypothetical protein VMW43_01275 [Bacteroidota bacterium]|nr:hypothetical protein [Bacteroidota bacterium]
MSKTPSGTSTAGPDPAWLVLYDPAPRPMAGVLRNAVIGILFAGILLACFLLRAPATVSLIVWTMAAGTALSLLFWSACSVWRHLLRPFLPPGALWPAALTRVPFWLLTGGIGYTFSALAGARAHLVPVNDRPVSRLFLSGSVWFGGAMAAAELIICLYSTRRRVQQ